LYGSLVLALVVFKAGAAAPEPPPLLGVASGVLIFLDSGRVRNELKLSPEQLKTIEELRAERRQAFEALRGLKLEERVKKRQELARTSEAALAKILTPKQLRRAEQLYLQRRGPMMAFTLPRVAATLQLTDEQKEKIRRIRKDLYDQVRDRLRQGQVTAQQRAEWLRRGNEKLLKVLTTAQKTKWKELTGPLFKWDFPRSEDKKQPGKGSDRPALPK